MNHIQFTHPAAEQAPITTHEKFLDNLYLLNQGTEPDFINPMIHWLVDGKPTTRIEAIKAIGKKPMKLYLNDKTWHQADWSHPDPRSMHELMMDRARQIRSEYDYVRVSYSGGVDSLAILTSFRDAGVAPDEILYHIHLPEFAHQWHTEYEIIQGLIPYLDTIKSWFPKTKITQINFDLEVIKWLSAVTHEQNPNIGPGPGIRVNNVSHRLALIDGYEYQTNAVTLTGTDKPRMDYINGNWYTYFLDASITESCSLGVMGFFTGADPALFIKQSHLAKEFLKEQGLDSRATLVRRQRKTTYELQNAFNNAIGRPEPFNPIVVSGKNLNPCIKNTHIPSRTVKDYLMVRNLRLLDPSNEVMNNWKKMTNDFKSYTGHDFFMATFGNFYNLDTGEVQTVDDLFPNGYHRND